MKNDSIEELKATLPKLSLSEPIPMIDSLKVPSPFTTSFHKIIAMGMIEKRIANKIIWSLTGSLDTFLLSWLFTSNAKAALAISTTEIVTKIFLYYGLGMRFELENKDGAGI